jgi:hypothetical protein
MPWDRETVFNASMMNRGSSSSNEGVVGSTDGIAKVVYGDTPYRLSARRNAAMTQGPCERGWRGDR